MVVPAPLCARLCPLNVEIVSIGDELLLGFTIDTNAAYLGRELASLGIAVVRRTSCGDAPEDIRESVAAALNRTGAVITAGGLGPTADDRSKESVAALFGRELLLDQSILDQLKQRWNSRIGVGELPQVNYIQAMIPRGAHVLANRHGSAPGILLEDERGRWVAMLPGVPREMRGMYQDALRPVLASRVGEHVTVVRSKTVRTTGVPESVLAEQLGELGEGFDGLQLAFLPNAEGVDLRLTSRGLNADVTDKLLRLGAERLRERIAAAAYGEDADDLAGIVLELCRAENLRIAVAESCTGGLLGERITNVPGSSDVFHGGLIAYDNRVKRQLLGVLDADIGAHGAVSEPVALQMAKGIRVRLGTEIGVSITGIAGPDGGTPEKPVGTVWIGIDISDGRPPVPRPEGRPPIVPLQRARLFRLVGDRAEIRQRAAQAALTMVRQVIIEMTPNLATFGVTSTL
jgi:nicotinamide-nucleotide amidase